MARNFASYPIAWGWYDPVKGKSARAKEGRGKGESWGWINATIDSYGRVEIKVFLKGYGTEQISAILPKAPLKAIIDYVNSVKAIKPLAKVEAAKLRLLPVEDAQLLCRIKTKEALKKNYGLPYRPASKGKRAKRFLSRKDYLLLKQIEIQEGYEAWERLQKQVKESIHEALTQRAAAERQRDHLERKKEKKELERRKEDFEVYKSLDSKGKKMFERDARLREKEEDDDLLEGF